MAYIQPGIKADVDTKHPLYAKFKKSWTRVKTIIAGEDAVRDAGSRLLPHPDSEHAKSDPRGHRYKAYQQRAVFMNATGRTLAGLVGIAFSKPATINASGDLSILVENADGEGKPLAQMVRDAVSEVLQTSRAGIMVEYTGAGSQTALNSGRVRFRLYDESQIINWRVTNNQTTLVVLKYCEAEDDPVGFGYNEITYWDEYRLIDGKAYGRRWTLPPAGVSVPDPIVVDPGFVPLLDINGSQLEEIPFCWIGAVNNDAEPDAPVLGDIASLNEKHYAREADLAEAAHLMAVPMLVMTGLNQAWVDKNLKDGVVMGSGAGIALPTGADARLLQAEERNLLITIIERVEKQMSMLGAKLVDKGAAAKTATQANDEAQTDNSILSLVVGNVERAFNKAFEYASMMTNGDGEVILSKRYDVATYDSQTIQTLMGAVQSGQLLLEDFVRYMQREGLVDEEETPESYAEKLRNQQPLNSMRQAIDENGNPLPIGQQPPAQGQAEEEEEE